MLIRVKVKPNARLSALEQSAGGIAVFMNSAQGGMVTADNRNLDSPSDKLRGYWNDSRSWSECERIGNLLADESLRLHVRGARIVGAHALEHLLEIVAAVFRAENPMQRMAVRAIEQIALQLVRTGRARQHFGIGELLERHRRGLELEVRYCGLAGRKLDRAWTVERIARETSSSGMVTSTERVTSGLNTGPCWCV